MALVQVSRKCLSLDVDPIEILELGATIRASLSCNQ